MKNSRRCWQNESEQALSSDIAIAWEKGFHYQKFESEPMSRKKLKWGRFQLNINIRFLTIKMKWVTLGVRVSQNQKLNNLVNVFKVT